MFVEGRQILDAILVASGTVGHWKKERKKGFFLKLDFEKAYDKVDWAFLDAVLKAKVLRVNGVYGFKTVLQPQISL